MSAPMLSQEYPSNVLQAIYRAIGDSVATIKLQLYRDPAWAMKTLAHEKKNILAGSYFTAEAKAVQCGKIDEAVGMIKAWEEAVIETAKPKSDILSKRVTRLEVLVQDIQKSTQEDKKVMQDEIESLKAQLAAQDDVSLMCDTASTCTTTQSFQEWIAGPQ